MTLTNKQKGIVAGAAVLGVLGGLYVYGKKNSKARRTIRGWMFRMKGDVLDQLEETKNLTQERYEDIVDRVAEEYAHLKDVGQDQAVAFGGELKSAWKNITAGFR